VIFKFLPPRRISPRIENNQKKCGEIRFLLRQCATDAATLSRPDHKKNAERAAGMPIWYHSGRITEANSQT
jgi:hypothetical protein